MRPGRLGLSIARRVKYATYSGLLAGASTLRIGYAVQERLVDRSGSAVRPLLVRWVDTSAIQRWTMPDRWPVPYSGRLVIGGDWDALFVGDLADYRQGSRNYRSTWQLLVEGRPYQATDQYLFLKEAIANGTRHPEISERGSTLAEVDAYFDALLAVFETIRRHGYRSQAELGVRGDPPDEVRVMVDRNGRLVRAFGGNHRFAAAQILGVPRIPVYVLAVHREWLRNSFTRAGGIVGALECALAAVADDPTGGGQGEGMGSGLFRL